MEPLVEPQFARVPPFRPEPDQASVLAALKVLQEAERPVIVAGGGVRASGAARELVALAEALQIPVATSLNGKDSIPGNHPLSVGVVGTYSRESANRVVNRGRPRLLHRHRDRRHDHAFLGGAEDRHAGDPDRHRSGGARPQLSAAGRRQRRRQGRRSRGCWQRPTAPAPASARPGSAQAQAICEEWYAKYKSALESDAVPIRPERICHELSKHVPDDAIVVVDTGHAGMWMGGMYDLQQPEPELHAQRRPSRLGVPGRPRRQVRRAGAAGGDVHRRRRLLVSHRRDRDRGALEDQRRHGGQQQRRRQPVQARLRPRLWRQADRAGARTVDLQQDELRAHRRGHGRARHPRREAERACRPRSRRRSRPIVRWSSTSSPTSRRWRRRRSRRSSAGLISSSPPRSLRAGDRP